jgi:hypothetical protein
MLACMTQPLQPLRWNGHVGVMCFGGVLDYATKTTLSELGAKFPKGIALEVSAWKCCC